MIHLLKNFTIDLKQPHKMIFLLKKQILSQICSQYLNIDKINEAHILFIIIKYSLMKIANACKYLLGRLKYSITLSTYKVLYLLFSLKFSLIF